MTLPLPLVYWDYKRALQPELVFLSLNRVDTFQGNVGLIVLFCFGSCVSEAGVEFTT